MKRQSKMLPASRMKGVCILSSCLCFSSSSRLCSFPTTNGSVSTATNRRERAFPCHQVQSNCAWLGTPVRTSFRGRRCAQCQWGNREGQICLCCTDTLWCSTENHSVRLQYTRTAKQSVTTAPTILFHFSVHGGLRDRRVLHARTHTPTYEYFSNCPNDFHFWWSRVGVRASKWFLNKSTSFSVAWQMGDSSVYM